MRMRFRTALLALMVVLLAHGATAIAVAGEGFRATVKATILSVVVEDGVAHIEAEGHGASPLLGRVSVDFSVAQVLTDGCQPYTAVETWTTGVGTLDIDVAGEICADRISGQWTVTGGSAGLSGGGAQRGVIAGQGNVVLIYTGTLTP